MITYQFSTKEDIDNLPEHCCKDGVDNLEAKKLCLRIYAERNAALKAFADYMKWEESTGQEHDWLKDARFEVSEVLMAEKF